MAFCKNHAFLYFDNLRRTEKAETVLCLIHASYQAKIKKGAVPPELRPLTTIIFLVVLTVVLTRSIYVMCKAKNSKKLPNSHKKRRISLNETKN